MSTSLAKKLQLKPGKSLLVLNPPNEMFAHLSSELSENALVSRVEGPTDAVLLFVNNMAETQQHFMGAAQSVIPGGLVWIAYPKKSAKIKTDISRDILWEVLKPTGWRPVRIISLDETWSVIRMRPVEDVKK